MAIQIPRVIETVGGAKVSAGLVGCGPVWSFTMLDGPMSGMEVVAARGLRKADAIAKALAASSEGEYMPLRIEAFAVRASFNAQRSG